MLKIISTASLLFLTLTPNIYAADPLVLSLNVSRMSSESTYSGAENKSKGYSTLATLSKEVYDGWYGTVILGYTNVDVDIKLNNGSQDVDVNTFGLAAAKSLGIGLSANIVTTYGKSSTDSTMILLGAPTSGSSTGNSLTFSGGLDQIVRKGDSDYTSVGIGLTHVSSTADSYYFNGRYIEKLDNSYEYLTLKAKETWMINGYKPFVSIDYVIANEDFPATNDKDYFRFGAGVKKEIIKDLTIGLSYSKIQGKDYASGDTLSLSITKIF